MILTTTMRYVVRKMATMEGGLVWFRGGFTMGTLFLDRWTCIWQMVHIRPNITAISLDTVKQTSRLTHYDSKLSKKNYALTSSNV